jgi:hypothetical protein
MRCGCCKCEICTLRKIAPLACFLQTRLPMRTVLISLAVLYGFMISLACTGARASGDFSPWRSVIITNTTSSATVRGCEYPRRLEIRSDGTFLTGPCRHLGIGARHAQLTHDEFARFTDLWQGVLESLERPERVCSPGTHSSPTFLDWVTEDGEQLRIRDERYGRYRGTCWLGDPRAIEELTDYMTELSYRHYPADPSFIP